MNGNQSNDRRRPRNSEEIDGIAEEVLEIKRVSKKTTGGSAMSFTALVVVGDRKGRVGVAMGRGLEVPQAIKKAVKYARKQMITVPIHNDTLPHNVLTKFKAARILLKPAPQGSGLKVGSVVRSILTLSGVKNASGKVLGSRNKATNARGVMKALQSLQARV